MDSSRGDKFWDKADVPVALPRKRELTIRPLCHLMTPNGHISVIWKLTRWCCSKEQ